MHRRKSARDWFIASKVFTFFPTRLQTWTEKKVNWIFISFMSHISLDVKAIFWIIRFEKGKGWKERRKGRKMFDFFPTWIFVLLPKGGRAWITFMYTTIFFSPPAVSILKQKWKSLKVISTYRQLVMSRYGFALFQVHFWLRTSKHLHHFHVANEQL